MLSLFKRLSQIEYHVSLLIIVPVIVGGVRGVLESLLIGSRTDYVVSNLPILHFTVFYMVLQMCIVALFAIVTGHEYKKFVGVVSVGLMAAWLPPFLDGGLLLAGLRQRHHLYFFFKEFSWNLCSERMLIGESIVLWMSLILLMVYLGWYSRSVIRAFLGGLLYYALIHILGHLWFVLVLAIVGTESRETIKHMDWIGLALVWLVYFIFNFKTMFPSVCRIGHALPWGLLAAIGARLSGYDWWSVVLHGMVFTAVVQLTIFLNDYFDSSMDAACGGKARPVTKNDAIFMSFIMAMLALHVFWIFPDRFYLIATFIAISSAYHLPGVRLKRFLGVSYLMEGTTAALAFMYGIGLAGLEGVSFRAILFTGMVFVGFLIGSIMKDYKDIDQDRTAGVNTLYTRLAGSTFNPGRIHVVISSLLTVALAIPAVYLFIAGESAGKLVLLGVLALVPQVCLLAIGSKRAAVQSAIWGVNAYLGVLVFILPSEFVRLF